MNYKIKLIMPSKKAIIYFLLVIYFVTNIGIIMHGFMTDESLSFSWCISEKCLNIFSQNFQTIISLNSWLITTSAIFIAAYSLKISISSLEQSKQSNILNNHINNLKFFSEHVEKQLQKSSRIKSTDIEIQDLYFSIFPGSAKGDHKVAATYSRNVKRFRQYIISISNSTKRNESSFDYRKHQNEIIKYAKNFHITLVNLHRKDFFYVEESIFELIDSLTKTFTTIDSSHYLTNIDIHYR